jgi:hypothetical protein
MMMLVSKQDARNQKLDKGQTKPSFDTIFDNQAETGIFAAVLDGNYLLA